MSDVKVSDTEKVENILLNATRPMTATELEEAAGLKRYYAYWPIGRLRKKYGCKLLETKAGGKAQFRIVLNGEVAEQPVAKFTPPKDLWRGWVNPKTGIVPERLGL